MPPEADDYDIRKHVSDQCPAGDSRNWIAPGNLPEEGRRVLDSVELVANAKTADEITAALENFDENIVWDVPAIAIPGRNRICVLMALAKGVFIESTSFTPHLVRYIDPETISHDEARTDEVELEVLATLTLRPRKTVFLPLSLLLPPEVPLEVTIHFKVGGPDRKVTSIRARLHNLPALPYSVRYAMGWTLGTPALAVVSTVLSLKSWATCRRTSLHEDVVETLSHLCEGVTENVGASLGDMTGPAASENVQGISSRNVFTPVQLQALPDSDVMGDGNSNDGECGVMEETQQIAGGNTVFENGATVSPPSEVIRELSPEGDEAGWGMRKEEILVM